MNIGKSVIPPKVKTVNSSNNNCLYILLSQPMIICTVSYVLLLSILPLYILLGLFFLLVPLVLCPCESLCPSFSEVSSALGRKVNNVEVRLACAV